MGELFEGPVQQWAPNDEGLENIRSMLSSDDELQRVYGKAYQNRCYIREFGSESDKPESGLTAVGDLDKLVEIEFRHGTELDQNTFGLGDCVSLGAYPGSGETRVERIHDGMRQVLEARDKHRDPDELDVYGSFVESGYKVDALIPRSPDQDLQWTIRVYKEGDDEILREETVAMMYEPIFGVDVGDKEILESRVDEIMKELTSKQ